MTLLDVNDELGASAAEEAGGTYVAPRRLASPTSGATLFCGVRPARPPPPERRASTTPRSTDITHDLRRPLPRSTLGVNVDGVFFGLQRGDPAARAGERRGRGHVVDGGASSRCPANPLYSLTKWALIGLVRSIHGELERRGIRINALCPGAVATPLMGEDPHGCSTRRASCVRARGPRGDGGRHSLASDRSGEAVLHRPPWTPRCSSSRGCPSTDERRSSDVGRGRVGRPAARASGGSTPGTGGCRCCSGSTSTSRPAKRWRCSAPTARARPRCCARSAGC